MKVYQIVIKNIDVSPKSFYVKAKDIQDAFFKATSILHPFLKEGYKAAEIVTIDLDCNLVEGYD